LEWSAEGKFENRPTVQAIARSEPIPFQEISTDSEGILHLKTELIHIAYQPNLVPFNDVNLKITWQCGDRCGTWHPSTIDFQNLGGTFTSLDLIHRNCLPKGVHPASVGFHGRREPWAYGRRVLEAIRRAFHSHVQFVPYFYHLSYIAHQKGLPLCRPLYLNYPEDEEAYQALTQYMLGDFVLVAPVVESGGNRSVYLPAGNWWERETGMPYSGSQHLNLFVPIDRVPVFVKSGSILPLQPVSLRVGNAPPNLLILEVYAGASGELDFYEDDGESLDYRSEGGSQRLLRLDSEGEYHRLSCDPVRGSYRRMPSERDFQIRWIGLKKVYRVEAQGVAIASRQWVGNRLEITLKSVLQTARWSIVVTA
jgi:hypothetical protein